MRPGMAPRNDAAPRMASYEMERARYSVEVLERFNAVFDIIERWAGVDLRRWRFFRWTATARSSIRSRCGSSLAVRHAGCDAHRRRAHAAHGPAHDEGYRIPHRARSCRGGDHGRL